MLWEVLFTIINAAREIRPNFKFYISGYNRTWLKDENSHYARQLPIGTIFSKKWGFDGEPVADPRISVDEINKLGSLGHYLIVLSHDVEEVMPLWMLEGDLFVQGVRQLANNPAITGLGGFTVQGAPQGFGHLDRILSARMNWDVDLNHLKLLENDLSLKYGADAAERILNALRTNSWALSSYFADYAGSLSFTGRYGDGSAGLATRFWDIIGVDAVNDTLALPDLESARHAVERFTSLLPQQLQAANEMEQAAEIAQPISTKATNDLNDAVKLMRLWVLFFESRLRLVEAVVAGYEADSENRIRAKITSATEYSKSILPIIKSMREFVPIFGYSHGTIEASLLEQLDAEISWLSTFDPHVLIRKVNRFNPQRAPLEISALRNYPNPFDRQTTLIYELNRDADAVSITIYTTVGRRVRVLEDASAQEGYNEAMWDGRDEDGTLLANGVYLYRIRVADSDEQAQAFSRLAILR